MGKYRPPGGASEIFAMICDVRERVNREVEIIPGVDGEFYFRTVHPRTDKTGLERRSDLGQGTS